MLLVLKERHMVITHSLLPCAFLRDSVWYIACSKCSVAILLHFVSHNVYKIFLLTMIVRENTDRCHTLYDGLSERVLYLYGGF